MGNFILPQIGHYDELTKKNLIKIYETLINPYSRELVVYNHYQEITRFDYLSNDCNRVLYKITMFEIEYLSKALAVNKSLVILDLSYVNLTDVMLYYLINHGLIHSSSIRHLILNHNRITCVGADHLSRFLYLNDRITKLDISFNAIGSIGFRCIGIMIRNNKTLNYLDVFKNRQLFEDNQKLNACLKNNTTILYFRNRFFSEMEILLIKTIIERNVSRDRVYSFPVLH